MSQWIVSPNDIQFEINGFKAALLLTANVEFGNQSFALVVWGPNDSDWHSLGDVDTQWAGSAPPNTPELFLAWVETLKTEVNQMIQDYVRDYVTPATFGKPYAATYSEAARYLRAKLKLDMVGGNLVLTDK